MPAAKAKFVHENLLSPEERALWRGFVRAHSAVMRRLDDELRSETPLSLSELEVLYELYRAPDNRLRMAEISHHLLLTRSGITRLVDRLERAGYVARNGCDNDGRVVYAALTGEGFERFEEAVAIHVAGIRRLFLDRIDGDAENLTALFQRLSDDA